MALTNGDRLKRPAQTPVSTRLLGKDLQDLDRCLEELPEKPAKIDHATIDLIISLCIIFLVYIFAASTDAFERFQAWATWGEYLEFDELIIVLAVMGALFGTFALRRLRDTGREISQRLQTEKTLDQRNQELAALYEATKTISSDLALEVVLKTVAEQVIQLFQSDGCSISLWDREQDVLVTLVDYSVKFPDETESEGTIYSLNDYPATRQVLETRQPLILSSKDHNADRAELALMERADVSSLLMLPLVVHDSVIGLLEIYQETGERIYTQEEINLIESLAAHAALTIRNARLYDDAQRRLRQTQALRAIDNAIIGSLDPYMTLDVFLDQVMSLLNVDAACVLAFDEHSQILYYATGRGFRTDALQHAQLRLGEGCAGKAALERRMIEIPDLRENHSGFRCSREFTREGFLAYYAVPLISNKKLRGVLEIFQRVAFTPKADWVDFLHALAAQAAIAIDNATLFQDLQRSNVELSLAYESTLEGWSKALDLRDNETEGHTQRVVAMAVSLGRAMRIEESKIEHIRRGAILHDIGKMGVPDSILLKAGPLSDDEWMIMRKHPVYAYEMLFPIDYLRPAIDIPYCHHEKWDGTGYPRGLKGEQIPLAARIFAVVDVWDALINDRPYRKAWKKEKALDYIREQSGKHFDPSVVTEFLKQRNALARP